MFVLKDGRLLIVGQDYYIVSFYAKDPNFTLLDIITLPGRLKTTIEIDNYIYFGINTCKIVVMDSETLE